MTTLTASTTTIGITQDTSKTFTPANKIASEFLIAPTEVESLHSAGFSYSELMIAYTLAQSTGRRVDDLLARHKNGEAWAQIAGH